MATEQHKSMDASPAGLGVNRYLYFGYAAAAGLVAVVFGKIVGAIWATFGAPSDFVVMAASAVVGVGAAWYGWKHPTFSALAKEIVSELGKVTWPTRKETYYATVVVLITTIVAAIILGVFDAVWSKLTDLIYIGE